jgi:hypothetical protein
LIYDPRTKQVIAINGLGMAPTGATPEFFKGKGFKYPPAYGPLAAVTPGTPGGIILMLQEYGTLSLAEVLAPAIELADGYPIDGETADLIERWKDKLKEWPYSKQVLLPHLGSAREAPRAGEIFRQPDLAAVLRKMVGKSRLAAGKTRKEPCSRDDRFIARHRAGFVACRSGTSSRSTTSRNGSHSSSNRSAPAIAASTSTSWTSGRRARRCCSR